MSLTIPTQLTTSPARRWYDLARAERAATLARLDRWYAAGLEPCRADDRAAEDAQQDYVLALRALRAERRAAARR